MVIFVDVVLCVVADHIIQGFPFTFQQRAERTGFPLMGRGALRGREKIAHVVRRGCFAYVVDSLRWIINVGL